MSSHLLRVALVDDDESVRCALSRLLRAAGMVVDAYASGNEFIRSLGEGLHEAPDCIVLDVRMPVMSGIEVQQRLGKSHPGFPIVFITAHDDPADRQAVLEAGARACLNKPFSEQQLLAAILSATANPAHSA